MNLRKLAERQECMLRLPGICNHNPETTVLAHIRNQWFGAGSKPPDICAIFACSSCHDAIDGRANPNVFAEMAHKGESYHKYILDAVMRQLHWYVKNDILKW